MTSVGCMSADACRSRETEAIATLRYRRRDVTCQHREIDPHSIYNASTLAQSI